MTLDPEFLQMLVCPDSKKRLREVPANVLAGLNTAIAAGGVTNRGGAPVTAALAGALQPEGEPIVYPVQDDIPNLLSGEAIPLPVRS